MKTPYAELEIAKTGRWIPVLSAAEQQDVADAADMIVEENWEEMMAPIIEPLLEHLKGARTADEFRARLISGVQVMDDSKLVEKLATTGFVAEALALLGDDEEKE